MKSRPILMSAPMVRAILENRKTQTRRLVTEAQDMHIQWCGGGPDEERAERDGVWLTYGDTVDDNGKDTGQQWRLYSAEYPEEGCIPLGQLYGAVGDQLWVRETWANIALTGYSPVYFYRADGDGLPPRDDRATHNKWRPSIFMPREASRITLEITGLHLERLNDISCEDAKAEGLSWVGDGGTPYGIPGMAESWSADPRISYRALWESINGPGSWARNPWVWVIEFKRISQG